MNLRTEDGRKFLYKIYIEEDKSIREIADQIGENHMVVFRALKYHNIKLKDKSQAQKNALKHGKSTPPVRRPRTKKEKDAISLAIKKLWDEGKYDRLAYIENAKKRWESLGKDKQEELNKKGIESAKTATKNRKVKKNISDVLTNIVDIEYKKKYYINRREFKIDFYFPKEKIAIYILSDMSELKYNRFIKDKNDILQDGGIVVWVRCESEDNTRGKQLRIKKDLVKLIKQLKKNGKPLGERFIEFTI